MDNNLLLFSKKLKQIRNNRHLTMEKLAEMADISPNHISKLECATTYPSFQLIERLADALNVEIKDLFNFDDLKSPEYITNEFKKLLNYSDTKHLQLLYKIHRDIIN